MLNAIQMGIINASTKQRLDELEDRKADIELQIIQEEMKHPMLTREDVTYWICRFRTLDVSKLEERRRLIDSFVNSVTVFDDYILITFNYKEGEERLDFTDIESSDLQSVGGPSEYPLGYSDFYCQFVNFLMLLHRNVQLFLFGNLYAEGLVPYYIQEAIYDRRKLQLPNQVRNCFATSFPAKES